MKMAKKTGRPCYNIELQLFGGRKMILEQRYWLLVNIVLLDMKLNQLCSLLHQFNLSHPQAVAYLVNRGSSVCSKFFNPLLHQSLSHGFECNNHQQYLSPKSIRSPSWLTIDYYTCNTSKFTSFFSHFSAFTCIPLSTPFLIHLSPVIQITPSMIHTHTHTEEKG